VRFEGICRNALPASVALPVERSVLHLELKIMKVNILAAKI